MVHISERTLRLGGDNKHKHCSWDFEISKIPDVGHFCDKEIRFAKLPISLP